MRRSSEASRLCHVGKCAIAVVAIENVVAPIGDEQIFKPVVVVVPDAYSVGPPRFEQPRFLGDICECAVTVVLVKTIARIFGSIRQTNSREDKNVEPAIVVVVQKCTTAASYLDDVVLAINATVDRAVTQTSSRPDILKACVKRQAGEFSSWLDGCLTRGHSLAKTCCGRRAKEPS